jgi:hypothetical protein
MPLLFLGETRRKAFLERMQTLGWGRLWTVKRPTQYHEQEPRAFDNGAFVAWKRGEQFPGSAFLSRMGAAASVGVPPYLAVTPDIVAGGLDSLAFSLAWRDLLRDDWPWYLAVQDGMRPKDVRTVLHQFAGVFLGGTDAFKETAKDWCSLAHDCGVAFHYGRAGTPKKIDKAVASGADSLDSAFPLWTVERFDGVASMWEPF